MTMDRFSEMAIWWAVIWQTALALAIIGQVCCRIRPTPLIEWLWPVLARVHQEMWLLVPPGVGFAAMEAWQSADRKWTIIFNALMLFNWWYYRNWPDENVWKRRGRKAKESVARAGARLIVVPATS
jgi:hypothetical protein